jgi:hypothetical protein
VEVFIKPNAYEAGRAHIVVYNWEGRSVVDVNVNGLLPLGTAYQVRNVQDYFGPPVLTGRYDGQSLRVPMTGLRATSPLGDNPRRLGSVGPVFGVFVLVGQTPPPTILTPPAPMLLR